MPSYHPSRPLQHNTLHCLIVGCTCLAPHLLIVYPRKGPGKGDLTAKGVRPRCAEDLLEPTRALWALSCYNPQVFLQCLLGWLNIAFEHCLYIKRPKQLLLGSAYVRMRLNTYTTSKANAASHALSAID